jgi:haloalkane dehalogenase
MTTTEKKIANIDGFSMSYIETGNLSGEPVVFLHGNPTSSYLWRNIMPALVPAARCIAPDLIGMGESQKLPKDEIDRYRFHGQYDFVEKLLNQLGIVERVTLVVHDWGSAIGFHWAKNHTEAVKGIAYMESMVMPRSWSDFPERVRGMFELFRSPKGDDAVLNHNVFVEKLLPAQIMRDLSDDEMAQYRKPFETAGPDRLPTLIWPREIPIDGEPADVHAVISAYGAFLAEAEFPKLFVNAEPGSIMTDAARSFCRTWPNQTEVTVSGRHFVQEDSPDDIGAALAAWYARL